MEESRTERLKRRMLEAREKLKGTGLSGICIQEGNGVRFWIANPDIKKKEKE